LVWNKADLIIISLKINLYSLVLRLKCQASRSFDKFNKLFKHLLH